MIMSMETSSCHTASCSLNIGWIASGAMRIVPRRAPSRGPGSAAI